LNQYNFELGTTRQVDASSYVNSAILTAPKQDHNDDDHDDDDDDDDDDYDDDDDDNNHNNNNNNNNNNLNVCSTKLLLDKV
jgi:hypothetical protein